jgi:hypothetical protein
MQLTDEVNWTVLDFVVAAALFLVRSTVRVHTKKSKTNQVPNRNLCSSSALLFLIWAELAVGIF